MKRDLFKEWRESRVPLVDLSALPQEKKWQELHRRMIEENELGFGVRHSIGKVLDA